MFPLVLKVLHFSRSVKVLPKFIKLALREKMKDEKVVITVKFTP